MFKVVNANDVWAVLINISSFHVGRKIRSLYIKEI